VKRSYDAVWEFNEPFKQKSGVGLEIAFFSIKAILIYVCVSAKIALSYPVGVCYISCEGGMEMAMDSQLKEEAASQESCHSENGRKSHHSAQVKSNMVSRLNRIEGQIRGVKGFIEKDTYCDDVLNQIAAIQSAQNSVGKILLENHLNSCVIERLQEGDNEVIKELMITMNKLMK
jgi:DNA-binding FrmR family transcriptional regulator